MSRAAIALSVATLVVSSLSGCKQPGGDEDARPTASPTASPTGRPRAVSAAPLGSGAPPVKPMKDAPPQTFGAGAMTVVIDEPGDEPRQTLRYTTEGIDRDPNLGVELLAPNGMTLRIAIGLDYQSAGEGMTFAVREAAVTSDKGPAQGPQGAMFERMRSGFLRVRGTASTVDGRQLRLTQSEGQWTTPPVPWLMHTLMVPLPQEPIGVGAKWTVEQAIDASGRKGRSKRTYELKERDADQLTIAIGGGDVWKAAGGKADGTTTLSGTVTASMSDPLPTSADLQVVEKVEATGKAPSGETKLTVRLRP